MSDERVISLPERFDFSYHKQFTEDYQGVLAHQDVKRVVLDFTRVSYLDSSALGMMVLLHKRAKPRGIETIARGAKGTAAEILEMANMKHLYRIA
ncbi:STAS domain-containing protein [Bowmanella sp. JS7-9]|uniref:STAS domain-containing protein n=1 Tax=Pseudobowmanella zhangzhouensis TaxID=1537679 RepID=A0ABW1XMC2_9ALTE|nr:STAS domain-containing protein [Bowmanella sp. JS7-9]TBX21887.1 SpoIIAA family protein [Bowmanella sp. JS7-9]